VSGWLGAAAALRVCGSWHCGRWSWLPRAAPLLPPHVSTRACARAGPGATWATAPASSSCCCWATTCCRWARTACCWCGASGGTTSQRCVAAECAGRPSLSRTSQRCTPRALHTHTHTHTRPSPPPPPHPPRPLNQQASIDLAASGLPAASCLVHPDTYLNKVLVASGAPGPSAGGAAGGGTLQLWNFATQQLIYTFKGWWVLAGCVCVEARRLCCVLRQQAQSAAQPRVAPVHAFDVCTSTQACMHVCAAVCACARTVACRGSAVKCLAASPALDVVAAGLADGRVVLHNLRRVRQPPEEGVCWLGAAGCTQALTHLLVHSCMPCHPPPPHTHTRTPSSVHCTHTHTHTCARRYDEEVATLHNAAAAGTAAERFLTGSVAAQQAAAASPAVTALAFSTGELRTGGGGSSSSSGSCVVLRRPHCADTPLVACCALPARRAAAH
jgi:hypothetical protein